MLNSNKITVDGNGNIILQGVHNSTVNITNLDEKAVGKALHTFFARTVHFLVIPPPNCTDIENWKPFEAEESLFAYLCRYCEQPRHQVEAHITIVEDSKLLERKEVEAYFRYMRSCTILIAAMEALPEENNQHWIQIFDDYHIGGCILVGKDTTHNKTFTFLNIYNNQLAETLATPHIHIENIFEKRHLDKHLGTIINRVLEIRTIKGQDKLPFNTLYS